MFYVTSEYNCYNIKLDETCNFVKNKLQEHKRKYGLIIIKL